MSLLQPPITNLQPSASSSPLDILIFAEDPGAANYIASLPPALAAHRLTTRLLTRGAATAYLHQRKIPSEPADSSFILHPSSLLVVGTSENPDSYGLQLIDEWRQTGGCSVGVVDAYPNAAHRFRGRSQHSLAHAPDWLIVPDRWTQQAFIELGFDGSKILVGGHPHYDAVREERTRLEQIGRENLQRKWLPDAPAHQQVIVFVAEISAGLEPAQFQRSPDYTLHGNGQSDNRTDIVIEEFLYAAKQLTHTPYLVLRLHPKNRVEEFALYTGCFDLVSSGGVPLELIYAADLVVGMSSMLLLEATLLQRPCLSILPRTCETDWLPTTRIGLTPCATTRPQIHALLSQILLQNNAPDTDIDSVLPVGSTERVTQFLAHLAAKTRD